VAVAGAPDPSGTPQWADVTAALPELQDEGRDVAWEFECDGECTVFAIRAVVPRYSTVANGK